MRFIYWLVMMSLVFYFNVVMIMQSVQQELQESEFKVLEARVNLAQQEVKKQEEKCEYGFSGRARCNEKDIEKEWIWSNCSSEWDYIYTCIHDCKDGECTHPSYLEIIGQNSPCPCVIDLDCEDFSTQEEAQDCYDYCWFTEGLDVHFLDSDYDHRACEILQ